MTIARYLLRTASVASARLHVVGSGVVTNLSARSLSGATVAAVWALSKMIKLLNIDKPYPLLLLSVPNF